MLKRIIDNPVTMIFAISAFIIVPSILAIVYATNNTNEFIEDRAIWNHGKCPVCDTNWILYKDATDDYRTYRCLNSHEIVITTDVDNWSDQKLFKTRIKTITPENGE